ncbi:MAG: hypothetical protein M1837_003381 [Sclerophora amabilis]|nr:MAG: hypothetical protein M1837_003381 [Sclerophora amabilis]
MADAPASMASTPQETATSNRNSEQPSDPSTPAPVEVPFPRRRRLGRPPKNKPPDWGLGLDDTPGGDQGSETGTPFKRRRGRPPTGGGRWGKAKGGPSHATQVPIDKEGNMMDVIDDEVALPEDAEGETKVDKMGRLQGDREYRCRTFTLLDRGDRLYMLSTEPARCIGFRDSYLFFQKHKQLYKIIIDENEKRDLILRDLIPHSYKGRAIGVVTARSVFREFGARIVVGGKKIVDDYQVQAARENGDVEGDVADPSDKLPKVGEVYNKNQYVAWHGASSVYHSGAPSVPLPNGKAVEGKKRKVIITDVNWMFEHSREASRFNTSLTSSRRYNLQGIYDPHTNVMQFPQITQPTHARWEQISSPDHVPSSKEKTAAINGVAETHTHVTKGSSALATNGTDAHSISTDTQNPTETILTDIAPIYPRNFLITDTHFIAPPISGLGVPGPDGDEFDLGHGGLDDIASDVIAELPPDCLKAFRAAREQERLWKTSWRAEGDDGARGKLRIGF